MKLIADSQILIAGKGILGRTHQTTYIGFKTITL